MGTSHCRRHHGFMLVLVLFVSYISCLASNMDVSYDARGMIKTEIDPKHMLSDSTPNPRSEFGRSLPKLGNQISVCRHQNRSKATVMMLDCRKEGYVFTKINFSDYGQPSGDCGHFKRGNCGAPATLRLVQKNCLGKRKCVFLLGNGDEMFGPTHCKGASWFVVDATCSTKT